MRCTLDDECFNEVRQCKIPSDDRKEGAGLCSQGWAGGVARGGEGMMECAVVVLPLGACFTQSLL